MFFAPTIRTTRFVPRSYDRAFERFVNDTFAGNPPLAAGGAGRQELDALARRAGPLA
jgi:hypothetical protein